MMIGPAICGGKCDQSARMKPNAREEEPTVHEEAAAAGKST
jgi:hypothetical protein